MHILVEVNAAGAALGLIVAAVRAAGIACRRSGVTGAVGGHAARGARAKGDVGLGWRDRVCAVCVVVRGVVVALAARNGQRESGRVVLCGGVGRHNGLRWW